MKVLHILTELTDNLHKKLTGFKNRDIESLPAILIAQFGKNDAFRNEVNSKVLMDYCMTYVLNAIYLVGGRIIILECKDNPKLKSVYENLGFSQIGEKSEKNLITMYKYS